MTLSTEFISMIEMLIGKRITRVRNYTPSFYLFILADKLNVSILDGVFANSKAIYHLGVGKSVYCLKTLLRIYGKWDVAKRYVVFMPQEFLSVFEDAIDNKYRIPALLWDDAGFWIGKQSWQTKFTKAVREFMNVIRTHLTYLMITAPRFGELARGIREQLDYASFVQPYNYEQDIMKRKSLIRLYHGADADYIYSRKYKPEPLAEYVFKTYFEYYNEYKEIRDKYVEIGKTKMESALREISEQAAQELNEIKKKVEPGARLDSIVDSDGLLEQLEAGDEDEAEYED